jgi:ribonuclease P/MRP protein subunit RPP40
LFLFADDAKMYKHIKCIEVSVVLNSCCQKLFDWSDEWLLKLNINKCKILSVGRKVKKEFEYGFNIPSVGFVELEHFDIMQDLGVIADENLSFKQHVNEKINKAYQMIGILNRNFKQLDKSSFILLYENLVRSSLEYANTVWSPYRSSLIEDLEKVQKRATKMVRCCKHMKYKERLMYLHLPTLKYRRLRGDMIEVYKILNGKYDPELVPLLKPSINTYTRGNSLKLSVERAKYDLRKYSFPVRVINTWNALPDAVVKCDSVNTFKNCFDKLWQKEELYYDYKSK